MKSFKRHRHLPVSCPRPFRERRSQEIQVAELPPGGLWSGTSSRSAESSDRLTQTRRGSLLHQQPRTILCPGKKNRGLLLSHRECLIVFDRVLGLAGFPRPCARQDQLVDIRHRYSDSSAGSFSGCFLDGKPDQNRMELPTVT